MILSSLTVSGLRCFRNPVTLADFDSQINIIHGPNESGKSTLIWGLILALVNRHNVGGGEIETFRPWGTSLNPAVVVEFISGNKKYRLEKRFLGGAQSILSEWDNGLYVALAEGAEADERVRQIMLAQFSGRGLTKSQHYGLANLLWMPQDKERFTVPAATHEIQDRLRQALRTTLFGRGADQLISLIDAEYYNLFTPARGDFRAGTKIRLLEQQLTGPGGVRERLDAARKALEVVSEIVIRLQEKENKKVFLANQLNTLKKQRQELEKRVNEIKDLQAQYQKASGVYQLACQKWETLDKEWQQVTALQKEVSNLEKDLENREKIITGKKTALGEVTNNVVKKEEALRELGRAVEKVSNDLKYAYRLRQTLALLEKVNYQSGRLEKARKLFTQIEEIKRELEKVTLPDAAALQKAEDTQNQINTLEAEARASGLEINITSYKDLEIVIIDTGGQSIKKLAPNKPLLIVSADHVFLDIPGVCRIDVKSGAKDLQNILGKIKEAKETLANTLKKFSVPTVQALREKYEWGIQKRNALNGLKQQLQQTLEPEGEITILENQIAENKKNVDNNCTILGLTSADLEKTRMPEITSIEKQLEQLKSQHSEQEEALNNQKASQKKLAGDLQNLEKELVELTTRQKNKIDELGRRLQPYGGNLEKLRTALKVAEEEKTKQKETLDELGKRLPEDPGGVERELTRLDREIEKLGNEELPAVNEELIRLKEYLEQAGNEGLYSQVALLEEEEELLSAEYRRELQRAKAIRLLHRIVHERREKMLRALMGPIKTEISTLFRMVTGKQNRSVELSASDLSIAGIQLNDGIIAPLTFFSVGTQEQLLIVVRLALGRFLATSERQLIILDDPMVNTDKPRQKRILDLLQAAAESLQLLILSCHPENYAALPGKRYDLEKLAMA